MPKYYPSDDGKIIDGKIIVFLRPSRYGPPLGKASRTATAAQSEDAGTDTAPEDRPPDGPYEIHAQLHAAGGTPMANERLRVQDPDTQEVIGTVTANKQGVVRARVPEEKTYHFFVADGGGEEVEANPFEDLDVQPPDRIEDADHAFLMVLFVDAKGAPLKGEKVQVQGPSGGSLEETTDDTGHLNLGADHGVFKLEVRGNSFVAHSLFPDEIEGETAPYRFEVH